MTGFSGRLAAWRGSNPVVAEVAVGVGAGALVLVIALWQWGTTGDAILRGLTDPIVKLSMGSTAEIVAERFGITRQMMDEYATESHRRTAFAQDNGHLTEVEPMYGPDGKERGRIENDE